MSITVHTTVGLDLIARIERKKGGQHQANGQHGQRKPQAVDERDERRNNHRKDETAADDVSLVEVV